MRQGHHAGGAACSNPQPIPSWISVRTEKSKMIRFTNSVRVCSDSARGITFRVHPAEAQRMFDSGAALAIVGERRLHSNEDAELIKKRKFVVTELVLPDHNPQPGDRHSSSSSLRTGYMQRLSGGELVRIDTPKESRDVVTLPCRVYKLNHIPKSTRPIYQASVLENLAIA